jgi:hypothetical protein
MGSLSLVLHADIEDGLTLRLLTGTGIGDLQPIVPPKLLRDGRLVEVIPKWHLRVINRFR